MFKKLLLGLGVAVLVSGEATASNLLFILDASGSMRGELDDRLKIDTAKATLSKMVGDLSAESKFGVMVYGHRYDREAPESCDDIELSSPVGQTRPDEVRAWLGDISPKGQTPMATSLERSRDAFIGLEEDNNNVVLISDGKETCGGDPCEAAGILAEAGINVKVHVVGFDVGAEEREQLECIAKQGNGMYFSADSTEGFEQAVADAVLIAQREPEPTPGPTSERVFFDDFDGSQLAEHWTVVNPMTDAYLVEDGQLLLFSGRQSGFQDAQMANLVTLTQPFPDGDWDAIVRFTGEFASGRDQFWVGLRKDENNFLAASVSDRFTVADDYHGDQIWLNLLKLASSEETKAPSVAVFGGTTDDQYKSFMQNVVDKGATLTISKRGRSYSATLIVDGVSDDSGQPVEWATEKLTSLRSPGELTIGTSLYEQTAGELLVFVDSVEIVKISE